MDFLIGVLASLVTGVISIIGTALASTRARWVLTGLLGRLLDIDIDAVFSDKRDAEEDTRRELRRANSVKLFTSRGNELQRETFDRIFLHRPADKQIDIKILLPHTTAAARGENATAGAAS